MSDFLVRLLWGAVLNALLAAAAWRAGSVRPSGAVAGFALGTVITTALGWPGLALLGGFFVLGSALTRWGYDRKLASGTAEAAGGARGASHALANAGFPALFALAAWATGEPVWGAAYAGSLATAAMDTAGSELGPLYGRRTVSLKTGRTVAPGTPGAVSLEGTLGGLAAAALLGALAWAGGLVAESQLGWVFIGALAGNLYEGVAGARGMLPHVWLNATNTLIGGVVCAAGVRWTG